MQCTRPIQLDEFLIVPCGHCMACKIAHSREWATRITHEASCHTDNIFLTLTYDEDHSPSDGSLRPDDLCEFWKHVRHRLGRRRIKYFACGEYGEKNKRPHYHAIVFGAGFQDRNLLKEVWGKGFIYLGTVTYDSARYVVDYMKKQHKLDYIKQGLVPPFQRQSQGIGLEFMNKNADQFRQNMYVNVRGVKTGLPRYYQKKLEIETSRKFEASIEVNKEKGKRWLERYGRAQNRKEWNQALDQSEQNIKARKNLYANKREKV